jgi:hypothetical protein
VASRDQILADLVAEVRKLTDEVSALRRDLAARDEEIAKLKVHRPRGREHPFHAGVNTHSTPT